MLETLSLKVINISLKHGTCCCCIDQQIVILRYSVVVDDGGDADVIVADGGDDVLCVLPRCSAGVKACVTYCHVAAGTEVNPKTPNPTP